MESIIRSVVSAGLKGRPHLRHHADDIAQDLRVLVWEVQSGLRGNLDPEIDPGPYLYRILWNKLHNRTSGLLRKYLKEDMGPAWQAPLPGVSRPFPHPQWARVAPGLATLREVSPEAHRALDLRFGLQDGEYKSVRRVAQLLHTTPQHAKDLVEYGIGYLRRFKA